MFHGSFRNYSIRKHRHVWEKEESANAQGAGGCRGQTGKTHLSDHSYSMEAECDVCFQMGLFVDMDPEEMMSGMEENLDDPDLEAELAAITGDAPAGRTKQKGKSECSPSLRICSRAHRDASMMTRGA